MPADGRGIDMAEPGVQTRMGGAVTVDNTLEVFDADQHYYEPLDAFSRHLPSGWAERTVQQATIDGRVRFIVGGRINTTISNPTFDPIVKPGAMVDYFRGNPRGVKLADCLRQREPLPDYYRDRDARLRKMDEQGVHAAWMLPTIGMAYEEMLQEDPEAAGVAFRAFNRWLLDDWGFNYQDRIFAAPYLAFGDVHAAAAEIEWALSQGARLFVVRPTGVWTEQGWLSPSDPHFDPIWARLNEARATLIPHVGEVGGQGLDRFRRHQSGIIRQEAPPLQIAVGHERAIANYLGALVCDKLFERFPQVRVASVENGAEFLPLLLAGLNRANFQRPDYFAVHPVEAFKRNIWVAPFWEDVLSDAVKLIGAERVLFGSDWPHPEGMVEPRDYDKIVGELDDPAAIKKIMYDNTAELTNVA
jgi:predicted TIM-barrel fold metal-dependent hydrolase